MARILVTSGPTRQYIDPVRYLTNASSGRMGKALAEAALAAGHDVVVVSGPVDVQYADGCDVIDVVTTEEMLDVARREFQRCDGLIGVAAPCDYRPRLVEDHKIAKTGGPIKLQLFETPDIVATLGSEKAHRWVVGFALETDDHHFRAIVKLHRKRCDLIVLNEPSAMHAADNQVEVLDPSGAVVLRTEGSKENVAIAIFDIIQQRLLKQSRAHRP
jgi:phosphopantothenoylcysteine decarboxylase/phosphopantothenate--cysteine ligase